MLSSVRVAETETSESSGSILYRTFVQSVIEVFGRKKGERLLRVWARRIADEENIRALFPRAGTANPAEVRKAAAWLASATPALIAAIPPD